MTRQNEDRFGFGEGFCAGILLVSLAAGMLVQQRNNELAQKCPTPAISVAATDTKVQVPKVSDLAKLDVLAPVREYVEKNGYSKK